MTEKNRIKFREDDIELVSDDSDFFINAKRVNILVDRDFLPSHAEQLKSQIFSDAEKAERLDKVIQSFDFEYAAVKDSVNKESDKILKKIRCLLEEIRDGKK